MVEEHRVDAQFWVGVQFLFWVGAQFHFCFLKLERHANEGNGLSPCMQHLLELLFISLGKRCIAYFNWGATVV